MSFKSPGVELLKKEILNNSYTFKGNTRKAKSVIQGINMVKNGSNNLNDEEIADLDTLIQTVRSIGTTKKKRKSKSTELNLYE